MRCKSVRDVLSSPANGAAPEAVNQHLERCQRCRSYAADCAKLRAGMRGLAAEPQPEPSWGFSARVLRRLGSETAERLASPEFLESAGRRVILATLVLVFTLLLAMILPSSGPVRTPARTVAYWPQTETASVANYPVDWSNIPALPAIVETTGYQEGR